MLELGKRDFYENSRIGLRPLRNNISYFGIDADQLLAQRPDTARRVFIELMALLPTARCNRCRTARSTPPISLRPFGTCRHRITSARSW